MLLREKGIGTQTQLTFSYVTVAIIALQRPYDISPLSGTYQH